MIYKFNDFISHSLSVRRIKFGSHKSYNEDGKNKMEFAVASCGDDHTVRFFNIFIWIVYIIILLNRSTISWIMEVY